MNSDLISELTWWEPWFRSTALTHFGDNPDFKGNLWIYLEIKVDLEKIAFVHFEIKVDFKRQLKFLNDFIPSLQWITLEFWSGCEYCYIEWTSCRWKGVDCLCKDLIPLLLIRCFHEIAIRQDQRQCCTFIRGALIYSSVKIVSLLLRRVWHSEFGPPCQLSLFCFSKFSHTFICI